MARFLEIQGRFEEAADWYYSIEEWENVAQCFEKAGKPDVAAEYWELAGKNDKKYKALAESCEDSQDMNTAKNWEKAAEAAEDSGDRENAIIYWQKAAQVYSKLKMAEKEALCWERGKKWEKAAMAWELSGNYRKSGEMWEKIGRFVEAARMYENAARKADVDSPKKLYRKAAELWRRLGNIESSAYNYELSGDFKTAAELFMLPEKFSRAGELWIKCSEEIQGSEKKYCIEKAIDCFKKSGDVEKIESARAKLSTVEESIPCPRCGYSLLKQDDKYLCRNCGFIE